MATLEQVEKLREKANVSFEEAKAALEACNDDLLEAIIFLERQGRINAPANGGYYSSRGAEEERQARQDAGYDRQQCKNNFKDGASKFGHFLARIFQIGNTNYLEARKNGNVLFTCPITALILLLIFFFWIVVPLFILSLFFGFRYSFVGNEIGTEPVNKVMDNVSDTAEDLKRNFTHGNEQ
jgi:hypothetical protein